MKNLCRKLLALLLCLGLLTCLICAVSADAGDFGGDSDFGGGGDWGGGDDGWDSDWGNDSDSGGSTRTIVVGDGTGDAIIVIYGVILVAVLLFVAYRSTKKKGGAGRASGVRTVSPIPSLRPMEEYRAIDPAFDPGALVQKLSNFYIQFQQCWQQKNIESLRPFFTDPYYAQMDRQLSRYRTEGKTNYVDRPSVLGIELTGFVQSGGNDHVYATVKTRIVDYTLNDADGKLLSGSKTAEKFMTYRYHLIRPTGTGCADSVSPGFPHSTHVGSI